MAITLAPTITVLPPITTATVLVTGSHGGLYPGALAAAAGVRAVIFSDAGVGRDEAGIASLSEFERVGIAAAAVSVFTARIGDAEDMMCRGSISYANRVARELGVLPGMPCAAAAERLTGAGLRRADLPKSAEARRSLTIPQQVRPVALVDSAAIVDPMLDIGTVVVTGSHGGLVGGDPAKAVKANVFAALFNDAGIGIDEAGIARLAALDQRGIAGATVAAASARIGIAASTYADGIVSRVNEVARGFGARAGMPARELVEEWARRN
jgi:hypothetical protein